MERQSNYKLFKIKDLLNLFLAILMGCLFASLLLGQKHQVAERYLKIKPGVSTRDDVEKLLGKNKSDQNIVIYKNKSETIAVTYSFVDDNSDECTKWKMLKGKVVEVFYVPQNTLHLKDVMFDLSSFKKRQTSDVLNHSEYYNSRIGVSVIHDENLKSVTSITLSLTNEQKKKFTCIKVNKDR